ncbi:MAG: sialate O-acetylesterase [Candidatus Gastranaerophilales bacterium]|nr:sialate O-acetylesterase [Candidatus Gastranaerophilales bacterium]
MTAKPHHQTEIDLFLFMGQSNMAGRGIVTQQHPQAAPALTAGAGYEYRAVSSPNRLYKISEPFGLHENRRNGIHDEARKTGSLVTAFANAYYAETSTPIVGVSASKGGSNIDQWQPNSAFLQDAISRLHSAIDYLDSARYTIRHKYMLWCQGESDGDLFRSAEYYQEHFENMLNEMLRAGIEKCFLIRIGHYNGSGSQDYGTIIAAQENIAQTNPNVILVSTAFAAMKNRGLMKDDFHYFQEAYNEVGQEAGINTARYVIKNTSFL